MSAASQYALRSTLRLVTRSDGIGRPAPAPHREKAGGGFGRPVGPALAAWTDEPPAPITGPLAVWLVLRMAKLLVGGYELGVNDGPLVRLMHRTTGTRAGDAWCASFVSFCCAILGARFPLRAHAYCPDLADEAIRGGVLGRVAEEGDIVLFWHRVAGEGVARFAHTGLVVSVRPGGAIETIEGNTTDDGGREGWRVCRRPARTLGPNDRVVHWHHLLPHRAGGPV
ncbi:MAG: hypothetical protein NVS9B3_00980 [Gemmatimonadaceae bacterium]